MFVCLNCGGEQSKPGVVSEVFHIGGRYVLVEDIPASICARCGEPVFSRDTTERVRRLVHSAKRPLKTEPLDVFALA